MVFIFRNCYVKFAGVRYESHQLSKFVRANVAPTVCCGHVVADLLAYICMNDL